MSLRGIGLDPEASMGVLESQNPLLSAVQHDIPKTLSRRVKAEADGDTLLSHFYRMHLVLFLISVK